MDHNASRPPSKQTGEEEVEQRASLAERGRQLYDRWAVNQLLYSLVAQANAHGREQACDQLELSGSERVLEIGCGPGVNFGMLVDGVGLEGTVVGVDYSAEMVQRATGRKDEHGWETSR